MTKTQLKTVSIARRHEQPHLSKGQKTFNALIKQIEQGRAQLAAWEAVETPYKQKYATELMPLFKDSEELQIKMLRCLDNAFTQGNLSKAERRKLAALITDTTQELLLTRDDDEIKAIFNKHSDVDYDDAEAANQAELKSTLEDVFGFELDDDLDLNSPESILEHAQKKFLEQQAQEDVAHKAWQEQRAKRKKSPKQLAAEAREQVEEQQLRHSIREIYRKLASALHPDRESDPQERERKTALMQRVNQAYDKNNLLLLLQLQLELEQIDQAHINNVSEDRLKHYNKILREQLTELQHEIMRVEGGFMAQTMLDPFAAITPDSVLRNLDAEIISIKRAIRDLKRDLLAFGDIYKLKAWLKTWRQPRGRETVDDFPF